MMNGFPNGYSRVNLRQSVDIVGRLRLADRYSLKTRIGGSGVLFIDKFLVSRSANNRKETLNKTIDFSLSDAVKSIDIITDFTLWNYLKGFF